MSRSIAAPRPRRSWGSIAATAFSLVSVAIIATVVLAMLAGYRPVVITTGSMGDAAPVGSLVIASPADASTIEVGDVIVMRRSGSSPITHRVIETGRDDASGPFVLTKGDANPEPDATPYALGDEELVARWVVPRAGSVLVALRDPRLLLGALGFLLVVGTAITLRRIWFADAGQHDDEPAHANWRPPPAPVTAPLDHQVPATAGWDPPRRDGGPHEAGRDFGAELDPVVLGDPVTVDPTVPPPPGHPVGHQLTGAVTPPPAAPHHHPVTAR